MSAIYEKMIDHPGAWTSARLPPKEQFQHDLPEVVLEAFDSVLKKLDGVSTESIERAQFNHPAINKFAADLFHDLQEGRGFACVKALPSDRYSHHDMGRIFWGLGTHMGNAVSQSVLGDRLGSIKNESDKDPDARAYRHKRELIMHTDASEIIGMLSLVKAMSGGYSQAASSLAVHNAIFEEKPEHLKALYEGFYYSRHGEQAPGESPNTPHKVPIFSQKDGKVSCRYLRAYMLSAARDMGVELPQSFLDALNYFDRTAARPDIMFEYMMEPGEMTFMNNYTIPALPHGLRGLPRRTAQASPAAPVARRSARPSGRRKDRQLSRYRQAGRQGAVLQGGYGLKSGE
jgi:Taurine catabolism dioxygenase TauD, TfdA family.